jgi:hypothetical protein
MPTEAYVPLATITLGSSASSITFSSIPAETGDLVLVINGGASAGSAMPMQFNADSTSSNYWNTYGYGYSANAKDWGASNNNNFLWIDTGENIGIVQIFDYASTNQVKHSLVRIKRGGGYDSVWMVSGKWNSTAAINSISFSPASGTLSSGMTASLYRIEA